MQRSKIWSEPFPILQFTLTPGLGSSIALLLVAIFAYLPGKCRAHYELVKTILTALELAGSITTVGLKLVQFVLIILYQADAWSVLWQSCYSYSCAMSWLILGNPLFLLNLLEFLFTLKPIRFWKPNRFLAILPL